MIGSLLIANRGEIARRVIRTARRLGVRSIAVFSEADADLPFVREADEAHLIGPAAPRETYLNIETLLNVARLTDAEAVHPGYGFLSENAAFAEAVEAAGLIWVGPPPSAIHAMGRKDDAKRLMAAAGVPTTPGYLGEDQDPARLFGEAEAIGWPVLIKAVAGGGGKGMRRVDAAKDFDKALQSARREAASAFGDDRVLLEKYVSSPRHLEVQVFGDAHGNYVHLFERDCSLQRRHQKVIEEAPAPGLTEAVREALTTAALNAARAVGYRNAGTVEFIADGSEGLRPDRVWFMEMNTRLQVEHPVTEMVTGLDLVEWQLRVASGESLPLKQDEIRLNGWAMEGRLYAEDPASGFLPSVGALKRLYLPSDIRIDAGVEEGGAVSPYYDPMIAKLIAHGPDRFAAAEALSRACAAVQVWPVKTNAAFLARLAAEEDFRNGWVDTGFIAERIDALLAPPADPAPAAVAAALASPAGREDDPWSRGLEGLRLNRRPASTATVFLDGERRTVEIAFPADDSAVLKADGGTILFSAGAALAVSRDPPRQAGVAGGDGAARAPMPGRITDVPVKVGDVVEAGAALIVLEAMKMEHTLTAPFAGEVSEVRAAVGDQVVEGVLLVQIKA
jgi:3-methylcrotonyl-CoA carboxylase alpha subunit